MPSRSQVALALSAAFALVGCAVSEPVALPAGATGGATGNVGSDSGGGTGTGGAPGAGGGPGAGGRPATDAGGVIEGDGGVGTFTAVYAGVIARYCFGSGCHNPGGGGLPSFSTQASCYNYFKRQGQLYPGQDPTKSYIYFVMSGDPTASPPSPPYMPPTPNANVSASDLAIVAAWIADGALND